MSYNYLSNALTRLAEQQGKIDTFMGTKFSRHMTKTIEGVKEVSQSYSDSVSAAYATHLKNTGQPVSKEIEDRKKYAKDLKEAPMQVDLSKSQAANESLYNQIIADNDKAYELTKTVKNPFASKKKKVDATNELDKIKGRFDVYKQDKDVINNLYKKAFEAQEDPDPNPSLLESRVHTELLDGSFKNNVVYNPVVDGDQKTGGYYQYENRFIALADLKTVNKVDLEFEETLAGSITEASELSRKGKWNESSRRELLSKVTKLVKANPTAVRPVIFNGFTADEIDGQEESYAGLISEQHYKEYENENNVSLNSYGKDMAFDELKSEDLTEGFVSYLIDIIDESAAGSKPADKQERNRVGRQATPLSVSEKAKQTQFVKNVDDPNQTNFKMFNSSDRIIRKGDKFFRANSKSVIYDTSPPMTREQLLKSDGLAIAYKLDDPVKTAASSSNSSNDQEQFTMTPEELDELFNTYNR